MKSIKLDWKGWWLLRTPMSNVPELGVKTAVFAVLGARLKKIGNGVGSSAREVVLFGAYSGSASVREYLDKVQKMSLGVFADNRCKEIRKQPIVYVAPVDDERELSAVVSLLYGAVPFAPKHAAMPGPYQGEPFHIVNGGKNPGLPEEIFSHGGNPEIRDSEATVVPEADSALAQAIAQEVAATRRMPTGGGADAIPTERVEKAVGHLTTEKLDKPPNFVETTRVDRDAMPTGIATERVDKPGFAEQEDKTEFVPRPRTAQVEDAPTILDEAEQEAS